MPVQETFIKIRDCNIRLRHGGAGEPLLYLHGASGAPAKLPFMDTLAEKYELLAPEHPGFGASDEPAWLENMHDLAYFYLDFLNSLDLPAVHLVGNSMGGWLAMEMAVRQPERFKTLAMVSPAGIRFPDALAADFFLWSSEQLIRNTYSDPALIDKILAAPQTAEQLAEQLKNRYTVSRLAWSPRLHDPFLRKWVHRLSMPTLLLWGDSDKVLPLRAGEQLVDLLPNARLHIFKGFGHLPHVERPDEFAAALDQHIQGALQA